MNLRNAIQSLREWTRPFYLRNIYFPLFPGRKPACFDDCWKFAGWKFTGTLLPAAPAAKPVLLILPMNDWHTRMQRTQHLALALARRGYRCLYLNPHLGREFPARYRRDESVRITQLADNVFEIHVHLPREPVFHHRLLNASEEDQLAAAILAQLTAMGADRVAQLIAFPVWLGVARRIRQQSAADILYDCHDYLPGLGGIAPAILAQEQTLFQDSRLVLCSAAALIQRAEEAGVAPGNCRLLRNAAAPEFLNVSRGAPGQPASPVVIGYIGALDSWFDANSVRIAAEARPEWQFQLIGRVIDQHVQELAALPNIRLVGEVPFHQLGEWLAGFHAALIPFVINPLIQATDPIKLYEYFAAGLPVVASEIPELSRFGALLRRYTGGADLADQLSQALASDSPSEVEARRSVARAETWDARAEELDAWIETIFCNGRQTME